MNYGEELAYWYLRLNGFFPISNFVIHKSSEITHTSDCDVLAIRAPHVFEEIGGTSEDWDAKLTERINFNKTIGIVCEVKTGRYSNDALFKNENLKYSILRLGFVAPEQVDFIIDSLSDTPISDINEQYTVCKLLIATEGEENNKYLFLKLDDIRQFVDDRIRKYPIKKNRDRMFFSSIMFQEIISRNA